MSDPAVRRLTKALAALAEVPDPLKRLDALRRAREAVEQLEQQSVDDARTAGATWTQIGAIYGVSKQAAQQRFRPVKGKRRKYDPAATESGSEGVA